MALKGTTRIELTNVKTGEREVIEKDNLVTNAVADLISMNPFYQNGNGIGGYYSASELFPICPNAIGGILLYEKSLNEDPDDYYAQSDNPLIGYASNDVNSTTEEMRGSMNQTESGALEDGSGYRFVFDFETSQANGTISAVGLTSSYGGKEGYGSDKVSTYGAGQYRYRSAHSFSMPGSNDVEYSKSNAICMIDFEQNLGFAARITSANTIEVAKYRMNFSKMPLVGHTVSPGIIEENLITTRNFGSGAVNGYRIFQNDGDGFIWGIEHANGANGNSSGSATLNWVKINPVDWSCEEGSWTIPLQLYAMGSVYAENGSKSGRDHYSLIWKGNLYCVSYDRTKVYRINLSNITDVMAFEFEDGSTMVPSFSSYRQQLTYFNVLGNVIVFIGGYIIGDKVYKCNPSTNNDYPTKGLGKHGCPGLKYKLYEVNLGKSTYYNEAAYIAVELMTPYLATINNLPTPVQKTADKTMKITYILREES